jgi:hypothetical protein
MVGTGCVIGSVLHTEGGGWGACALVLLAVPFEVVFPKTRHFWVPLSPGGSSCMSTAPAQSCHGNFPAVVGRCPEGWIVYSDKHEFVFSTLRAK